MSEAIKNAVVAGELAGQGLTAIANTPNPAGQAILARFFPVGLALLEFLGTGRRLQQSSFGNFYVPDDALEKT